MFKLIFAQLVINMGLTFINLVLEGHVVKKSFIVLGYHSLHPISPGFFLAALVGSLIPGIGICLSVMLVFCLHLTYTHLMAVRDIEKIVTGGNQAWF